MKLKNIIAFSSSPKGGSPQAFWKLPIKLEEPFGEGQEHLEENLLLGFELHPCTTNLMKESTTISFTNG